MAVKIEKETIIGDILDVAPQAAPLFFAICMHCLGCPSSRGPAESLPGGLRGPERRECLISEKLCRDSRQLSLLFYSRRHL